MSVKSVADRTYIDLDVVHTHLPLTYTYLLQGILVMLVYVL